MDKIERNAYMKDYYKDPEHKIKRNKIMNGLITARKREVKKSLIEYKGGKCESCGYNKSPVALEFHHKDPDKKDFAITQQSWKNIDILKREVDKCLLLCSNCHKELHNGFYYRGKI